MKSKTTAPTVAVMRDPMKPCELRPTNPKTTPPTKEPTTPTARLTAKPNPLPFVIKPASHPAMRPTIRKPIRRIFTSPPYVCEIPRSWEPARPLRYIRTRWTCQDQGPSSQGLLEAERNGALHFGAIIGRGRTARILASKFAEVDVHPR
jgi:hypothetical protein